MAGATYMKISYQTEGTALPQLSNISYNEQQMWTTTIKGELHYFGSQNSPLIMEFIALNDILQTRRPFM